ncbi:MAG: ComEC/Rec2 family competence protein, partial [Hyphomicrobiaceae bacterium]|nr:ComEC/Rec2 family competence protein [Hyphomicrobiaceae bacterium]
MVIGRREDIPVSLRRDFTDAGLAHLLAISGLHVGLLAAWLIVALTRVVRRPTAWLISCVLIWGYVSLLGFPVPATRAAGFLSIHAVSRARQRHPPPSAVLAVALLAVLLIEPGAATAVGAWLSVAAVWGTGAAGALLTGRLARRPLVRLAAASAGATLATAPVT